MNNELIERIDQEIQNLMGQRDVIERLLPNNTAVREPTQIIKVLMDCKAALSQHSEEAALLRSKIDTLHRLMVTAEKRGASQEAEPVASSQPTELEMHRADYNAIQAAGFDSPGELLAAYNTLQAYTGRDLNQFIEDEADRPAWFMGGAENVVCVSDLRQWMAGHARVQVEPTEKMILAAIVAADRRLPFISDTQKVIAIWNAMLTASKESGQ